jgi:WD40 repeat protein
MIFSTMDRTLLFVLEGHHAQQITQVRFSPTGPRRLLATASFDKTVHIWNLDYDKERPVSPKAPIMVLKKVHEEPVWSIDFISSPNGLRLCSIDASGKLAIWDIDSGTALYTTTIKTPDDRAVTVRQLKAAPIAASHPSILAIANGTHVELFDCGATLHVASLLVSASVGEQKGKAVVALCWGDQSSGETLVTTTVDSIAVWDLSALLHGSLNTPVIPLAVLSVPADKLTCCTHLDGRVVIGGYQTLYLWEVGSEGRERSVRFPAHDGLVVSVSRSAGMLASASHDGWVKLWQLEQTDDRI